MDQGWTTMIGVVIGGVTTLGGAVLTQLLISRRDEDRYARERSERREVDLRAAYADWLSANQRAMLLISGLHAMPPGQMEGGGAIEYVSRICAESTAIGSRLRLLESDTAARMKTTEALQILSVLAAKLSVGSKSDFMDALLEIDAAARQLGELERWVLEKRFPTAA